jgi:hypothetical protein
MNFALKNTMNTKKLSINHEITELYRVSFVKSVRFL